VTNAGSSLDGSRAEWQALISEVEETAEALTTALAQLRLVLRRVAVAEEPRPALT